MKTVAVRLAEGIMLDWLVAKAECKLGVRVAPSYSSPAPGWVEVRVSPHISARYAPTLEWDVGGFLISRYRIHICPFFGENPDTGQLEKMTQAWVNEHSNTRASGPTLLVAAMRSLVIWKLGDAVDVPDAFVQSEE